MQLARLTLDISPTSLFWRLILSGCSISMVFATLSGVSLGTISKSQTGNASGIFNFLHNVSGSVGIAVANTISLRHLQAHRNDNVHWFTSSNIVFQRAAAGNAAYTPSAMAIPASMPRPPPVISACLSEEFRDSGITAP